MKRINHLKMQTFALMTGLTMCMLTACSSDGFNPGEGIGNHMLSAVVTLMAVSMVKDPADMEKILISNNIFDE